MGLPEESARPPRLGSVSAHAMAPCRVRLRACPKVPVDKSVVEASGRFHWPRPLQHHALVVSACRVQRCGGARRPQAPQRRLRSQRATHAARAAARHLCPPQRSQCAQAHLPTPRWVWSSRRSTQSGGAPGRPGPATDHRRWHLGPPAQTRLFGSTHPGCGWTPGQAGGSARRREEGVDVPAAGRHGRARRRLRAAPAQRLPPAPLSSACSIMYVSNQKASLV